MPIGERHFSSRLCTSWSWKRKQPSMQVRLKAIGSIGQVSPPVVEFPNRANILNVKKYIVGNLSLYDSTEIWCYVGNAFVPSIDDDLVTIAGMSGIRENEPLVITYSSVEAFG